MTDVAVAQTPLVPGTKSADLVGGGTDINTGETAVIACANGETRVILFIQELDSAALTLSVEAGDYPPAATQGKGALAVALDSLDQRLLVVEGGRHLQNNGTIRVLVTGGCRIFAFTMPAGY